MDVVTAVMNDHRVLEDLLAQLFNDPENRPALLVEVRARLLAHARAEEKQIYPALVRARPDDRASTRVRVEEHRGALDALGAVESAGPADFTGRLAELVEAVHAHVRQVERELLPALGQAMSSRKRDQLGRAFESQRHRELKRAGIDDSLTKEDLYIRAQKAGIPGRSSMSKEELARALLAVKTERTSPLSR